MIIASIEYWHVVCSKPTNFTKLRADLSTSVTGVGMAAGFEMGQN
jgi:hypothetical protein